MKGQALLHASTTTSVSVPSFSLPHHAPVVRRLRQWQCSQPCLNTARGAVVACSNAWQGQGVATIISPPAAASSPGGASTAASPALIRVANLASAWAKVSRRLTMGGPQEQGPGSDSDSVQLIIKALRLALTWLENFPVRADGRPAFQRAVQLAVTLAELSACGLPLDAEAIAAGVLSEAADGRLLDHDTIRLKLGDKVATLVHDILRVRTAPTRVELYDDTAASAIREWCIAFNDIRANVVEVVSRWDDLRNMGPLPLYEKQQLALEALQVYAPLGHALGMGAVSAAMEDVCFQVLFPESYAHTSQWLRTVADPAEEALYAAQQQLLSALDAHPQFNQLASGCVLRARTKSLFSMMKKLLRLGDMSKGGRRHDEVFDLLGMRAVVQPRTDLSPDQAEAAAIEACYVVQEVAQQLWQVIPGRTKDYIQVPKANGYRCIHLTCCITSIMTRQASSTGESAQEAAVITPVVQDSSQGGGATQQGQQGRVGFSNGGLSVQSSDSVSEGSTSEDDGWQDWAHADAGQLGAGVIECSLASGGPYLELQIRTQAMDDRAESGEAAHTAYKGGLDSRQARQLQAWSQELRQRLAIKPQGKLLLPPSVVARQEGAFSMLDSVDIDLDIVSSDVPSIDDILASVKSGGSSQGQQQAAVEAQVNHGQSDGTQQLGDGAAAAGQEAGSVSGGVGKKQSPAEELFRFMDLNADGKVSMAELQQQLREMSTMPAPVSSTYLNLGYQGSFGAIAFDSAADLSAMQMWAGGMGGGGMGGVDGLVGSGLYPGFQGGFGMSSELMDDMMMGGEVTRSAAGQAGVGPAAGLPGDSQLQDDLEQIVRSISSGDDEHDEMSLDQFSAFLKQAGELRRNTLLQEQGPPGQQLPPPGSSDDEEGSPHRN